MAIETYLDYCQRHDIQQRVKEKMEEGWSLLYVLPPYEPPQQTNYSGNSTTNYLFIGPDGRIDLSKSQVIPSAGPVYPTPNNLYELVFIKRHWESEPCPKCNYPFPNEDDIGRDG